ncbi:DNA glycosylase [Methanothermobacter thermautotrophicus]|jgi:A/G-specific adenine glycosylase|uniref:DNA glycosylase n=1 Tax=Methanothermobacter thermautotrophicus TaxID=145262 RepID=UPI0017DC1EBA|nr:DNA glycosylase [Methanothermobacter thermautotrophicus]WBF08560.1 DNA glycosylase [Methanothermobacter thermautotrophicus]HIH70546.1 DNA glycosylase [Methanothermobacter thermautotrophicus]
MLHRTRAEQVLEVYENFVEKFPDFKSVCEAGQETIEKEMESLGLRWRARSLHKLACEIESRHGGAVPKNKNRLLELPGIGNYISSAFLCFSENIPEPLLDTNTVRIIGRLFDLEISDSSRRKKDFETVMRKILEFGDCRHLSLSMIDFGEAVCRASDPLCHECPLKLSCSFYRRCQNEKNND